jgi:hypothetical protein
MKNKNGALAPTAPACLEKAIALTPRHLELIRTAGETYRLLFAIRGTAPEWAPAHHAWREAAEALAIAVIKHVEQLEANSDDRTEY